MTMYWRSTEEPAGLIRAGRSFKPSWIGLFVTIAALLSSASPAVAQAPAAPRPILAGTWVPSDPGRSDKLFDVGLTTIPGRGRLTIEQRPDRFTVMIAMPDDKLDPLLTISGRFYPTVIYRLTETEGRPGGFGASGPLPPSRPTWFGDQLVIPDAWPSARRTTATYSRDGERLKLDTRVEIGPGRDNTVTVWFSKVK